MAQLAYDSVTRTWAFLRSEIAFTSTQRRGQNPTLAIDDLGTVWSAFLSTNGVNSNNSNRRVVNRVNGGNLWTDLNLVFGPTDRGAQRSARLLHMPGGMCMVWTVREATCWSLRTNGLPDNSARSTSAIFSGLPTKPIDDP